MNTGHAQKEFAISNKLLAGAGIALMLGQNKKKKKKQHKQKHPTVGQMQPMLLAFCSCSTALFPNAPELLLFLRTLLY